AYPLERVAVVATARTESVPAIEEADDVHIAGIAPLARRGAAPPARRLQVGALHKREPQLGQPAADKPGPDTEPRDAAEREASPQLGATAIDLVLKPRPSPQSRLRANHPLRETILPASPRVAELGLLKVLPQQVLLDIRDRVCPRGIAPVIHIAGGDDESLL